MLKISIKIILSVLFLVCWLKMPYSYYQFVRFVGMLAFIWFAYLDNENKNKPLSIFWACSGILINPIIKISLGRTMWNIVDLIWVVVLVLTLVNDFDNLRMKKEFD